MRRYRVSPHHSPSQAEVPSVALNGTQSTNGNHPQTPVEPRRGSPEHVSVAGSGLTADSVQERRREPLIDAVERSPRRQQAEVLANLRAGCSLWGSAQAADVRLVTALQWLDDGEKNPESRHREFAREVNRLQARRALTDDSHHRFSGCLGLGQHHTNGNGNGNGQRTNGVLTWRDL